MSKQFRTLAASLAFGLGVHTAGADTMTSEGYSLEDYHLKDAQNLADICTLDQSHPDHTTAMAFCYGFFEGAIHYHDMVKTMPGYVEVVCDPEDTTREEAVAEFTRFLKANPQHGGEMPLDAVVRGLSARWPCPEE